MTVRLTENIAQFGVEMQKMLTFLQKFSISIDNYSSQSMNIAEDLVKMLTTYSASTLVVLDVLPRYVSSR